MRRIEASRHQSHATCFVALLALACSADDAPARSGRGDPSILSRPPVAGAGGPSLSPQSAPPLAGSGANLPPGPAAPSGNESCGAISQQAQNQRKPADIIVAVDNSGSMDEEIAFVRERLNSFSQQIVSSGVDARIILISAPLNPTQQPQNIFDDDDDEENGICIAAPLGSGMCPQDSKAPGYFHVPVEVGSHDALDLFIETFPQYQAQLRSNATKTFVVVTDDNAEGANDSAAAFTQSVAGLPGGLFSTWTFSGIYCFTECPEAAEIGAVYDALVQQTKGVAGDLCLQNFAPVFDALAKAVVSASGLDCAWSIPPAPAGQTFNRDQVNVQYTTRGAAPRSVLQVSNQAACGTRSGWYYDDPKTPTRILACPATCSELQNDLEAKVEVLLGCDTLIAPD